MAPRGELSKKQTEHITALGVIAPPPIHVQTPVFEGSLAALFKCVKDHKVHLLDVPLYPICEAYFAYLIQAELKDLDEAAAALAALAYLLERKAWALLPVDEPEPEMDEALELVAPTAHEYEVAIEALRVWHDERSQVFFRPQDAGPDPYELPYTIGNVSISDLALAFDRLMRRAKPDPVKPLNKPRKSLSEQMGIILKAMTNEWRCLEAIIEEPFTRSDVVYSFLALLELIRLGQVAVRLEEDEVQFARAAA